MCSQQDSVHFFIQKHLNAFLVFTSQICLVSKLEIMLILRGRISSVYRRYKDQVRLSLLYIKDTEVTLFIDDTRIRLDCPCYTLKIQK